VKKIKDPHKLLATISSILQTKLKILTLQNTLMPLDRTSVNSQILKANVKLVSDVVTALSDKTLNPENFELMLQLIDQKTSEA
jgi:hypothetical protein